VKPDVVFLAYFMVVEVRDECCRLLLLLYVVYAQCSVVEFGAPCGLWGCKNWPAPIPGQMSQGD